MQVCILRHGQAHPGSASGFDRDRELTVKGLRQAHSVGVYLSGLERPIERVIVSPYTRTRQTGGAVSTVLGLDVEIDDRLGSDQPTSSAIEMLRDLGTGASIVIVGHHPTVGQLLGVLTLGLGGTEEHFATGEVAVVRIGGDAGGELIGRGVCTDRFRHHD